MFAKRFYILYFFLCFTLTVNAQKYIVDFTKISINEGFSGGIINQIFEDSQGFVWMATKDGASRFNGKECKVFLQDKNPIHSNDCRRLIEDVDQNIWTYFSKKKGSPRQRLGIYHFLIDKCFDIHSIDSFFGELMPFPSADIVHIYSHKNNELYLLNITGEIYKYDGEFKKVVKLYPLKDAQIKKVQGEKIFIQDFEKNKLIVVENEKIWKKDGLSTKNTIPIPFWLDSFTNPGLDSLFKEGIFDRLILTDTLQSIQTFFSYPTLWKGFPSVGVRRFNHIEYKNESYFIESGRNRLALFNSEGQLLYDFQNELITHFGYIPIGSHFLIRQNQIWFNTIDGVYIINYTQNYFETYLTQPRFIETRGIFQPTKEELIVCSNKDIYKLNLKTKEKVKTRIEGVPGLWGVAAVDDKKLLFGSYIDKLIEYDLLSNKIRIIKLKRNYVEQYKRKGFLNPFVDKQKNIWLGTSEGLITLNKKLDSLELYSQYNEFEELKTVSINYFGEEGDSIWLATSNGLFVLDSEKGITGSFKPLPNLDIYHFYKEGDIFWLATYGDGLIKWNKETGKTTIFGKKIGFLNNHITAIYPDDNGNLWIATETGLIKFKKDTEDFQIFLESNGISDNEFNRSSHFKSSDGKLYLGGLNGITTFHPDSLLFKNQKTAPFLITDYWELEASSGKLIDKTNLILKENKIVLEPNVQSFTISFSLLNYFNIDKTRYAWKLERFDKNWTYQKEDFIRFNQIPYGEYNLRIKAKDYSGQWNPVEISIPVHKIAPFYAKLAYKIAGMALLLILIVALARWRINQLNEQKIKLEELVKERTKTINDQKHNLIELNHSLIETNRALLDASQIKDRLFAILGHDLKNPVLAFQRMTKTINYLAKQGENERILKLGNYVEKEAQQLYHLVDNLLNWALSERNELVIIPTSLNFAEIIHRIIDTHFLMGKDLGISLKNEVPKGIVILADSRVIEVVFRNLISNAFQHLDKRGWIKISAKNVGKQVKIIIEDNGSGIPQNQLDSLFEINLKTGKNGGKISFGLFLCKELIELLNGQINIENSNKNGTTFIISLPIGVKKSIEN